MADFRTTREGLIQIGSLADYTEIENDGTIRLVGDAIVWLDLHFPLQTGKIAGVNVPVFTIYADDGAGSPGVGQYLFQDGDEMWGSVYMPSGWLEGSAVYPYVRWMSEGDATGKNIGFGFEYTFLNTASPVGLTSCVESDIAGSGPLSKKTDVLSVGGISGVGKTIGSEISFRIFRQSAQQNNYAGGVFIFGAGVYCQADTIGSRDREAK